MRRLGGFVLAIVLLTAGNAAAQPASVQTIDVAGLSRLYTIETDGSPADGQRVPAIIFLHGSRTDVRQPIDPRYDLPFATAAGTGSLLVVRPQGIDGRWNYQTVSRPAWRRAVHWLLGRSDPPDDVAFLRELAARLVRDDHADPQRIYVVGVSSGGYMAVRVACDMAGTVAGVAAVLATAHNAQLAGCTRPVPILLLAGTTDPAVSYAGWQSNTPGGALSAPATVAYFAHLDGCTARTEQPLPHRDPDSPSTVSQIAYSGCKAGTEVLFYRVDGSGHSVPSLRPPEPGDWAANGARNTDLDTAQAVWTFFARHQRGNEVAAVIPR